MEHSNICSADSAVVHTSHPASAVVDFLLINTVVCQMIGQVFKKVVIIKVSRLDKVGLTGPIILHRRVDILSSLDFVAVLFQGSNDCSAAVHTACVQFSVW